MKLSKVLFRRPEENNQCFFSLKNGRNKDGQENNINLTDCDNLNAT